jgi:lysozyme
MSPDEFRNQLKRDEGLSERVYLDSEKVPTIGWGHALLIGSKIPLKACELILEQDISIAEKDFDSLNLPIDPEDTVRRFAFINMVFNLGITKFRRFEKMLSAVRKKDWLSASAEMMNSKWAGQVGDRAKRLSEMIKTGKV